MDRDGSKAWTGQSVRCSRPGRKAGGLKVGIDARSLLKQRTGVERMAYHFIENLPRVGPDHDYVLFVDRYPEGTPFCGPPYDLVVEPVRFPRLQKLFDAWILFQVGALIPRHGIDLFFSPHTKFPAASIPRFTTIHGLEWHESPSDYTIGERIRQWAWFQGATRLSAGMITFSGNTERDIRKIRPDCRTPVCVVPEGVDPMFRPMDSRGIGREARERLGVVTPFIMSVCTLDPRKNLESLIRAFALVVKRHAVPHALMLVGKAGRSASRLAALAAELKIQDRVRITGYLTDAELVQMYNQAELFVYPSKYEGFGLPVLEAMASGLPVVTSDGSALAEVAGNAAILVDPFCVEGIAEGIAKGLMDDGLRTRLVEAGLERVRRFSWEGMTRRIVEFMSAESAVSGGTVARVP